jgi:alpha-tubulin suppressor-like RCC1 family protein
VKCWGEGYFGELGTLSISFSSTPIQVQNASGSVLTGVTSLSIGGSYFIEDIGRFASTCGVVSGNVRCWGSNYFGILGNGQFDSDPDSGTIYHSFSPVSAIGVSSTASTVSLGLSHVCSLLSNGSIQCWGDGQAGKLGNGSTSNQVYPVSVTGIATATAVSSGENYTCAILSGGSVKCWGAGGSGQLGTGSTANQSSPVFVSGITNATAISAGREHACALLSNGTVKCWGSGYYGQLSNASIYGGYPNPQTVLSIP